MKAASVARAFPELDRYRFLGQTGFVSDDTEQSALVAQCLARNPHDRQGFLRSFRRSLLGWFLRLPWGIGLATLRACLRIAMGLRTTGVASAGNGAAMRSAIVGAFFFDSPETRTEWSDSLATVTHTDPRAVEGARFVGELAAQCVARGPRASTEDLVAAASEAIGQPTLRDVVEHARRLARAATSSEAAGLELGNTGFVVHTLGITTFCFLRFGDEPSRAIAEAVRAGGDTDSHAAIVGAWVGARHGLAALPAALVSHLQDGPFGRTHLLTLAADLDRVRGSPSTALASYSWFSALARNLALYPVVLMHAFHVFFRR